MRIILLLCLGIWIGCGDVASTHSSTVNTQDNSTDNSQVGISHCTEGTTLTCDPDTLTISNQCVNVNGEVVTLSGPDPVVDGDGLADACPTPEPVVP